MLINKERIKFEEEELKQFDKMITLLKSIKSGLCDNGIIYKALVYGKHEIDTSDINQLINTIEEIKKSNSIKVMSTPWSQVKRK